MSLLPSPSNPPSTPTTIPAPASVWALPTQRAALAGAIGGLIGFVGGEISGALGDRSASGGLLEMVWSSALWAAIIGTCLGLTILAYDNWQGLRGKWQRDLGRAIPLFLTLGFGGGALGQFSFSFVQNSLTRGIGWALMGLGVGAGIGLLRRDKVQARRGALGGMIGGFLGGFIFNALTLVSAAGGGALSRAIGLMMMGALIAVLMRAVQDAMKSAWLVGITEGPYARREYPLNTGRVSVGQSELNDIALYRERELPPQVGALVSQGGEWWWQGVPVAINGALQSNAALRPGDVLQFGGAGFRFQTRSAASGATNTAGLNSASPILPAQTSLPPTPAVFVRSKSPGAPVPVPATVAPPVPPVPLLLVPAVPDLPSPTNGDFVLRGATGETIHLPTAPSRAHLGRSDDNQIVLSDEGLSGRHARFDVGRGALTITDSGSTNGTFLNGRRLQAESPVLLRDGDELTLGRLEYQVVFVPRA